VKKIVCESGRVVCVCVCGRVVCHAKRRWMSPSATPAYPCHAKTKVDVAKCHACHAKCRGAPGDQSAPPDPAQCHTCHACHAKCRGAPCDQRGPSAPMERGCREVPRLRRKWNVDVAKCHGCHTKCRGARATNGDQARHQIQPSAISAMPATQMDRGSDKGGEVAQRILIGTRRKA